MSKQVRKPVRNEESMKARRYISKQARKEAEKQEKKQVSKDAPKYKPRLSTRAFKVVLKLASNQAKKNPVMYPLRKTTRK